MFLNCVAQIQFKKFNDKDTGFENKSSLGCPAVYSNNKKLCEAIETNSLTRRLFFF